MKWTISHHHYLEVFPSFNLVFILREGEHWEGKSIGKGVCRAFYYFSLLSPPLLFFKEEGVSTRRRESIWVGIG